MFQTIQKSVILHQLFFDEILALNADNSNSKFGVNHSLFTNIKEMVPESIKGNCYKHIVHNCIKHSMNFLSFDIENLILQMYNHVPHSAVKKKDLKKFVNSVDDDFHDLKYHVETRWSSLLSYIDTTIKLGSNQKLFFQFIGENCPIIFQNLFLLKNNDLIEIYIHFCSQIIILFNKTLKYQGGKCITILDVYNVMSSLKNELTKRKEERKKL